LHVDLEHDVPSGERLRRRRAVQVVEDLGPFEETTLGRFGLELLPADEGVGIGRLSWASRPGGPGPTQPERVVTLQQVAYDGALADAAGAEQDEDQERIIS